MHFSYATKLGTVYLSFTLAIAVVSYTCSHFSTMDPYLIKKITLSFSDGTSDTIG